MANIGRMIAAAGALAGGYMQGKKMQEDADWEKERRQQERDAMQREADMRQAAASTLGAVGTQTGAAASGEEALAAGNQAQANALASAKTPEEAAAIKEQFAPTMAALVAQQGVPAQPGAAYTQDQAQSDYIKKAYGIDPAKAQQAEATQMQIDEGRDKTETRKKLKSVDSKFSEWFGKSVQKGEDGQPMLSNDTLIAGSKMRTILMAQHGLYDQAMQTAKDGMQYATQKIQSETEQRKAAVRDAVSAYGMGDTSKALSVYKQFVPDGADPVSLADGKDGSLVLSRKSALDGAPLPAKVFKDKAEFLASLNALSDGNALAAYVERTFQHDIESRKVKASEDTAGAHVTTAGVAKAKEDRVNTKEDKLATAAAGLQEAIDSGDEKAVKKARVAYTAAGGKLEKPAMEFSATTDALGNTNVVDKTTGGGMKLNTNGATIARWNGVNDKPKTGEEKIVQDGPNKGKTVVFDGKGWALKP